MDDYDKENFVTSHPMNIINNMILCVVYYPTTPNCVGKVQLVCENCGNSDKRNELAQHWRSYPGGGGQH